MHVEWSIYVKKEGHAGRAGRRRSGHGGEDHWKSGWQNRLCRKRYKPRKGRKKGTRPVKKQKTGLPRKAKKEAKKAAQLKT